MTPTIDRVKIKRRDEFNEKVGGKYYTYYAEVRIDEKLMDMMREFINFGAHADFFLLVDEKGNEVTR